VNDELVLGISGINIRRRILGNVFIQRLQTFFYCRHLFNVFNFIWTFVNIYGCSCRGGPSSYLLRPLKNVDTLTLKYRIVECHSDWKNRPRKQHRNETIDASLDGCYLIITSRCTLGLPEVSNRGVRHIPRNSGPLKNPQFREKNLSWFMTLICIQDWPTTAE